MSLLRSIRQQLGLSVTSANNFTLDASADNGTMKLARGNAGATTQDILTVDAAGNVLLPQTPSIFSKYFESTQQTIVAGGLLTLPHGMGKLPKLVRMEYVCSVATDGYSIGDVIEFDAFQYNHTAGTAIGFSVTKNSTDVLVRVGSSGPAFIATATTGGQIALANVAPNFKLVVRAWA